MPTVEVVVAGHVSLDVFPALHGPVTLEPGRLIEIGPAAFSTGGAVTNTGLALHRLGVPVRLVGRLGADLFGRAVLDMLERRERGLSGGMVVGEGEVTSYTIVINPPGVDRSFLHCPGANQSFTADDVPYDQLPGVRLFHFGYPPLMPRIYAGGGAQLASMFERVHAAGPGTSLDMCVPDPHSDAGRLDWERVLARALPHVDVFAPSVDELLFMLDRASHDRLAQASALGSVVDRAHLQRLSATLFDMGATIVAIKLGAQGLYLRTTTARDRVARFCDRVGLRAEQWRGREILAPCFRPRRIMGTTGSGDTTIAGLLAAILRGEPPAEAATAATAVGACSVEEMDPTSGVPSWREVAARIASGWERLPAEIGLDADEPLQADPVGTLAATTTG
ncbi:MAG TPA: carbohydrate kinase family protein [Solirubrobacteraceae bacterium]|nr:carbohydrate kinase family protein [Solirubrobacteraceae bacterium]